jgi:hypothetical protein
MNTRMVLVGVVSLLVVSACSPDSGLVANPREPEFYSQFVNPADRASQTATDIESLRLIQTGDDYAMRFALFANGTFYYQVDRLGDGFGDWVYESGALKLIAERPMFNMNFYVSALEAEGDATTVRFLDRHGYNSYSIQLRDPEQIRGRDGVLPSLRPFVASTKGI